MPLRKTPWALALVIGCSAGAKPNQPLEPGTKIDPPQNPDESTERARVSALLAQVENDDRTTLLARHQPNFQTQLGYDPSLATGLSTIQATSLALSEPELARLGQNGFVISERKSFPSFVYGYETLYGTDLPLFVSADSILHAVHRSFDDILAGLEQTVLTQELDLLLSGMRENLTAGRANGIGDSAEVDADFTLAVAQSLLRGAEVEPVAGADSSEIKTFVDLATTGSGTRDKTIFGFGRTIDFSQFTPRGHYTASQALKRYFRAMIWLGRIDLRIIEAQPDLSQVFHRRSLEGALALYSLIDSNQRAHYDRLDTVITAFIGEHDNLTIDQLGTFLADVGAKSPRGIADISDEKLAVALAKGSYGAQRISSQIMINGLGKGTMPLSSIFLLLGQRYTVDSHVFSNVVYDRVAKGSVMRMMPSPLDAAFAALGNDQAAQLLEPELTRYDYASALASMRVLVDDRAPATWDANLYSLWLSALRTLSPPNAPAAGVPSPATTEAWGRRLLNTQLASWAELRHDTILYVKQSYTGGVSCEFPDAYVEPNPAFFGAIERYAGRGRTLIGGLDFGSAKYVGDQAAQYFRRLEEISGMLKEMAEYERSGTPFTQTHLAFINEAVRLQPGCGSPSGVDGWYADLFFDRMHGIEYDPTIADVHTQPTDEAGNDVGRVLHVATGRPRLFVTTFETCQGPRAYAGLASSYFEKVTENYQRVTDEEWKVALDKATPADPAWLDSLIVR